MLPGVQFDWGKGVGFGSNNRKVRDIVKFYYAFTSSATNVASRSSTQMLPREKPQELPRTQTSLSR